MIVIRAPSNLTAHIVLSPWERNSIRILIPSREISTFHASTLILQKQVSDLIRISEW